MATPTYPTDGHHRRLVVDQLDGATTSDEDALLASDPVRWRAALIRLGGLVNGQIAMLNPIVKRINAESNAVAQVDAMRRRAAATVPEERRPEVVYIHRTAGGKP